MPPSAQFPNLVMIIRHGEKPGDPNNDKDGGPNLSILGSARAAALPSLFTPDPTTMAKLNSAQEQLVCQLELDSADKQDRFIGVYGSSKLNAGPPRFPVPDFLFATAPSHSSSRPLETITPLVQALQFSQNNPGLSINDQYNNDANDKKYGYPVLASTILGDPATYGDKRILICWHHGTIPELTEDFKVPASQLPFKNNKWPGTVFDLVFKITWDTTGQANLEVDYQQLLFGDTSVPATLSQSSSH